MEDPGVVVNANSQQIAHGVAVGANPIRSFPVRQEDLDALLLARNSICRTLYKHRSRRRLWPGCLAGRVCAAPGTDSPVLILEILRLRATTAGRGFGNDLKSHSHHAECDIWSFGAYDRSWRDCDVEEEPDSAFCGPQSGGGTIRIEEESAGLVSAPRLFATKA